MSLLSEIFPVGQYNTAHAEVMTTTKCEVDIYRKQSEGEWSYKVDTDGEPVSVTGGGAWGDVVDMLRASGCPCPESCMVEADYDLDFLAGLSDR